MTALLPVVEALPPSLRNKPRWIVADREKQPRQVGGSFASSTDPATWATFEDALAAARRTGCGVGYVLDASETCIDIDRALDDVGNLTAKAAEIVADLRGWAEVSRSGRGIHIFAKATKPAGAGSKREGIEVYAGPGGRYIAMTGRVYGEALADLPDRQTEVEKLCARLWPATPPRPSRPASDDPPDRQELMRRARAYVAKMPPAISGSGGHDATWRVAVALVRGFRLDHAAAFEILVGDYNPRCEPQWTEREIMHKIESAGAARLEHGYLVNRPDHAPSALPAQPGTTATPTDYPQAVQHGAVWPEPMSLEPDPPPLLPDVFPPAIHDMVHAVAATAQVDPALVAVPALGALAAASLGAEVLVRNGWSVPTTLYLIAAAVPSERKSAILLPLVQPLRDWEASEIERTRADVARRQEARRAMEARLDATRKRAARNEDESERETLGRECGDLAERLEREPIPARPRLIAGDATPEALAGLLAQHGRLAVIDSEGGIVQTLAGRRYSADGSSNLDLLLKSWAGEPVRVDRRDRCDVIERPLLAIAVMLQPALLREMLSDAEFLGRGLLSRCLIVAPPSRLGRREIATAGVPGDVSARYAATLQAILAAVRGSEPVEMHYSNEADLRMRGFERDLEPRLHPEDGDLGDVLCGWAGKLAGQVARLSGLLHLGDCAERARIEPEIPAGTVERAIRLGEFFIAHALHAVGTASADPRLRLARRIAGWIRRRRLTEFSTKEAFDQTKNAALKSVDDMRPALEILVERGWIRPTPAVGGPGRPSEKWILNPALTPAKPAKPGGEGSIAGFAGPKPPSEIAIEAPEDGAEAF